MKKLELLGREMYDPVSSFHLVRLEVDFYFTQDEHRGAHGIDTPSHRPDTCDKLFDPAGLRNVLVGAGLEGLRPGLPSLLGGNGDSLPLSEFLGYSRVRGGFLFPRPRPIQERACCIRRTMGE
jgi:hypothetical protein